jgi:hypothetical protein
MLNLLFGNTTLYLILNKSHKLERIFKKRKNMDESRDRAEAPSGHGGTIQHKRDGSRASLRPCMACPFSPGEATVGSYAVAAGPIWQGICIDGSPFSCESYPGKRVVAAHFKDATVYRESKVPPFAALKLVENSHHDVERERPYRCHIHIHIQGTVFFFSNRVRGERE